MARENLLSIVARAKDEASGPFAEVAKAAEQAAQALEGANKKIAQSEREKKEALKAAAEEKKRAEEAADNLKTALGSLSGAIETIAKVTSSSAVGFIAFKTALDLVGQAKAYVTEKLAGFITASEEAEKAQKSLSASLGASYNRIAAYNSILSAKLGIDDDDIANMQAKLLAQGIEQDQLEAATRAALGYAAAVGGDETRAIRKVVAAFKDNAAEAERLTDMYRVAEAQAETFTGRMRALETAVGDTKEIIGDAVTKNETWARTIDLVAANVEMAKKSIDQQHGSIKQASTTVAESIGTWASLLLIVQDLSKPREFGFKFASNATIAEVDKQREAMAAEKKKLDRGLGGFLDVFETVAMHSDTINAENKALDQQDRIQALVLEKVKKIAEERKKDADATEETTRKLSKADILKGFGTRPREATAKPLEDTEATKRLSEMTREHSLFGQIITDIQTVIRFNDEASKGAIISDQALAKVYEYRNEIAKITDVRTKEAAEIQRAHLEAIAQQQEARLNQVRNAAKTLGSELASAFSGALFHAQSFGDAVLRILDQLAERALATGLEKLFELGLGAAAGGGSGVVSGILSALGFANGGVVPQHFASGGIAQGPGGTDRVPAVITGAYGLRPARLSAGEGVIPPEVTAGLRRALAVPASAAPAVGGGAGAMPSIVYAPQLQGTLPGSAELERHFRDTFLPTIRNLHGSGQLDFLKR